MLPEHILRTSSIVTEEYISIKPFLILTFRMRILSDDVVLSCSISDLVGKILIFGKRRSEFRF
jgi:hypothetical protein